MTGEGRKRLQQGLFIANISINVVKPPHIHLPLLYLAHWNQHIQHHNVFNVYMKLPKKGSRKQTRQQGFASTFAGPTDTWRPAIGAFFRMQTRQQGFATARMSSECFSEKRGSISEMIRLSREADSDSLCPVNPSAILRLASLVTLAACGLSVVAEEDGKQERALRDTCLSRTVSSVAWLRDVA